MKDFGVKILDEEDHIFIKALSDLGMSRNAAKTMAYLMNVDEASSQEIEISTGLRQPEVSLAMSLMHKQSWINVRSEKRPGKGRPTKIYSLAAPVDEVISYYEDKIFKESQATISAIKKLKVMSKQVCFTSSKRRISNRVSSIMADNPCWESTIMDPALKIVLDLLTI